MTFFICIHERNVCKPFITWNIPYINKAVIFKSFVINLTLSLPPTHSNMMYVLLFPNGQIVALFTNCSAKIQSVTKECRSLLVSVRDLVLSVHLAPNRMTLGVSMLARFLNVSPGRPWRYDEPKHRSFSRDRTPHMDDTYGGTGRRPQHNHVNTNIVCNRCVAVQVIAC